MGLNQKDLDAIRRVVRQEVREAVATIQFGRSTAAEPEAFEPDPDDPDDARRAAGEVGAATVAKLRGDRGGAERELRAEAYYRSRYDEGWIARAKRARRDRSDGPVTEEEMRRFIVAQRKLHESNARERAARSIPNKGYVDVYDARRLLNEATGVSAQAWIRRGRLTRHVIDGKVRVSRAEIDAILAEHRRRQR